MKGHIGGMLSLQGRPDIAENRAPSIVAIGDVEIWRSSCGSVPRHDNLHFCSLEALNRPVIELCRPELIVSPVVTGRFDCIDVAGVLSRLGFAGAYRALARQLPDPEMICREVRAYFPTLDFEICEIQPGTSHTFN